MLTSVGCSLFPATHQRDQIHNPFPQVKRVAVLPFYNQSKNPTVDTELVAEKYYAALQAIPGFEVLPVGVTKTQWMIYSQQYGEPVSGEEFQQLAEYMGVEALVVGSVTAFDAYYPPTMAMTVHWYAANEGFHPIPNGYGLPWGTQQENDIPSRIVRDTQFDLARSQLATQTPAPQQTQQATQRQASYTRESDHAFSDLASTPGNALASSVDHEIPAERENSSEIPSAPFPREEFAAIQGNSPLIPKHWPDPTDLIPDPPSPHRS